MFDSLTYVLENIYKDVFSGNLIPVYTDLFGYDCKIYTPTVNSMGINIYTDVYGNHEGSVTSYSLLEERKLLISHENFDWTNPSQGDIGTYSALQAFTELGYELPINGMVELLRADFLSKKFRIVDFKIIGSTTDILKRYNLAFVEE